MEDDVRSDLWTYPTAKCSESFNSYSARDYITTAILPMDYSRPDCSVPSGMSLSTDKSQEHRETDLPHAHPLSSSWHSAPPISHQIHNPRPSAASLYSAGPLRQDDTEWRIEESRPASLQRKYEICVLLVNKVGLCVEMDAKVDRSTVLAQDILDLIFQDEQEFSLPPEARNIFSLWMISPLLELQLKPIHRPFLVRQQWGELLKKYTFATPEEIDRDDPVLFFQRNIFYDKSEEQKITDMKVLELLYEEAKANILEGRYPCDSKDAEMLASIQARLELGLYDLKVHTPEFFRRRLRNFLPPSACAYNWSLSIFTPSKSSPEQRIIDQYRNIHPNNGVYKLRRKYLEFCWTLPYYGSAFFPGQIEKPVKGIASLINHHDTPVVVAINKEGIHVTDSKQGTILLSLKYREMSWDYAFPSQSKPECLHCLFVQFKIPSHSRRESKILQIFSRQACLMDNLISAFVDEIKQRSCWEDEIDGADFHDSSHDEEDDFVASSAVTHRPHSTAVTSRLQRLSLSTFNDDGDCIDCRGSLSFK